MKNTGHVVDTEANDRIVMKGIRKVQTDLATIANKVKGQSFVVTGGAGFLGSWLCDTIVALDGHVTCVDNLSSGSEENIRHLFGTGRFSLIKDDVRRITISEETDFIVHMASIASPALFKKYPLETLDANVLGTRNMLETAKNLGVRGFLFTSTSEVYGDAAVLPTPESYWGNVNPVGPRGVYDEGKRVAETYCRTYWKRFAVAVRIARVFNTYGPRLDVGVGSQYGRVVTKFIGQALSQEPLTVYGDGSQTRSFCYVTDMISGLLRLLTAQGLNGEVVNLGGIEETPIIDLANLVIQLTETSSPITYRQLPEDDPRRRKPDIAKAIELLGWKPSIGLREGLSTTIDWLARHCETD